MIGAAAVGTGEECILAIDGNGSDRPFDDVGIDLDTAVVEEAGEPFPLREGVADRLGKLCLLLISPSFSRSHGSSAAMIGWLLCWRQGPSSIIHHHHGPYVRESRPRRDPTVRNLRRADSAIDRRGIAIAGPSGIAVAFDESVVLKAGPGGALVGFCQTGGQTKLVIEAVFDGGNFKPDTFYRFKSCAFIPLSKTEEKKVLKAIDDCWRKPWVRVAKQLTAKKTRRPGRQKSKAK